MALADDIRLLSQVPLFSDMDSDQLRLIAFGAEKRAINPGQVLFREHAPAECAFVVASGRFQLSTLGRDGHVLVEKEVSAGTLLSELALITMVERKYTAVALQDSDVLKVTRTLFHRLLEEYPRAAQLLQARIRDNLMRMAQAAAAMENRFQ
ncbi:cyclic nucleotide-binding domain-containing protein [Neorhizobium sp. NPDC001467]|uniref:cyclic nucleotide-binding domain-containing protein n=1 Tax=Neorhizobium sp. NPDC001467 TaxID=3390595 RepID=UPI003D00EA21